MPRRSVELGDSRLDRVERLAALYEVKLEDMILRLLDAGMSALPPVLPAHHAHLLIPAVPPNTNPPVPGAPANQTDATEDAGPHPSVAPSVAFAAELEWRVQVCFNLFAKAYVKFKHERHGLTVPAPKLDADVRRWIVTALKKHDADLLKPEDRERWKAESQARAAGVGIFYDDFMTGVDPRGSGTAYLSPTRPWQPLQGKPDPVPRFAQLYFDAKALAVATTGEKA